MQTFKEIVSAIEKNSSQAKDKFLNEFGSNVTYVANAYSGQPFLLLYFHPKFLQQGELNKIGEAQCLKVSYGKHKRYKRELSREFMTGIVENADGQLEALFFNCQLDLNRSYIVTPKGKSKESNYETGQIWHDYSDKNYEPSQAEIEKVKAAAVGRINSRSEINGKYLINMSNITNSIVTIDSNTNLRDFNVQN